MTARTTTAGITFAVSQVERATKPLPTCKTHEALNSLLDRPVKACCDYTADCVRKVTFHPLLATAHFAFSQHRPLVLSPDMIWVAVVQGLARHVNNYAERLRGRLVSHRGKLEIRVERDDLLRGSPENAWDGVVHDLSGAIKTHLGPRHHELAPDFSTTGPVERTACEVALLDCFQPYFEYRMVCICGIPEITLEGTAGDWRRLRQKVEALAPYDLDWWLPDVRQVCDQFVRASQGDVDVKHWQDIYKRQDAYGWDNVNGWLVKLVPYLKNGPTGNYTVKNPLLEDPDAEVSTNVLPGGVSQVPFRCRWQGEAEEAAMEFLGGFVGVTQDATTLALRPKLGWAVRQGSDLDRLSPASAGTSRPRRWTPRSSTGTSGRSPFARCRVTSCPFTSTATASASSGTPSASGRWNELSKSGAKTQPPADYNDRYGSWETGPWVRFCDLADGGYVAIELDHTYQRGWKVVRVGPAPGEASPIVAWSFRAFLEKALGSSGRLDVLEEVS